MSKKRTLNFIWIAGSDGFTGGEVTSPAILIDDKSLDPRFVRAFDDLAEVPGFVLLCVNFKLREDKTALIRDGH
jgi:hypothetical protein